MSIRRGYYYLAGDHYDGPFQTIKDAKAEASKSVMKEVSIRAMVVLEKRDERGEWVMVH